MGFSIELSHMVNGFVGAFLLAFALLVARRSREPAARRWLAGYLAVVGAGYAAQGLWWLAYLWDADRAFLARLGRHANQVDPALLLLFAVVLRRGRAPGWLVALSLGTAAALASQEMLLPAGSPWWRLVDLVSVTYVLACYLGAFALLAARWLRPDAAGGAGDAPVLVLAFAPICLTRVGLAYADLGFTSLFRSMEPQTLAMEAGLALAFGAFALAALRLAPDRAEARRVVLAVGALLLVVGLAWVLRFVPALAWPAFALRYSARWFLFAAVIATSLAHQEVLGVPRAAVSRLRVLFHALLCLAAAGVAASLLTELVDTTPAMAFLVGVGVVGLGLVAFSALRLALPPRAGEMAERRVAAYRARLLLGADGAELSDLERRLGLTPEEARRARDLVAVERAVSPEGVAPGLVLAGRFEVGRVVGAGTFGRVFEARDRLDGAGVVLKELRPEWAAEPEALARFRREADVLLSVSHPNVVAARALEPVAGGGHVLVLERVEGESLAARLRRGPLAPPEARALAEDLLGALDALHRRGILHRDVKPANLMLRPDGRAVLLDLGAAGRSGTRPAAGHPGSPRYESPEQARGEALGPPSDLYAAALVLWESLAGQAHPRGEVPPAWRAPLARALEADPARRFPSAKAFLESLPRA